MQDKENLRKQMLLLRKNIPNKKNKSQLIVDKIINCEYFKKAMVICLYKPLKDEVDINNLINYSLEVGKIVLLPKIENNQMLFIQINQNTLYERSSFHVLEPIGNEYSGSIDLVIVPGLAFDKNNNRLGYGKGFYDRFMKGKSFYKIGVCFMEQMVNSVPIDSNDIKLDLVINI